MEAISPYITALKERLAPLVAWMRQHYGYVIAAGASLITFGTVLAVILISPPRMLLQPVPATAHEASALPESFRDLQEEVAALKQRLADEQESRKQLRADFQAANQELAASYDLLAKHGERADAAIQELNTYLRNASRGAATASGSSAASSSAGSSRPTSGKVNLNTASAAELTTLPGIGPSYAERIIQHRAENGPFSSVEQITNVRGIGPATLEKLRDLIEV